MNTKKKVAVLLLTFIMALGFTACAGKRPAKNNTPSSQTAQTVPSQAAASSAVSKSQTNSTAKSKTSSQLDDVYSALNGMQGTVGSLDDVDSQDMSIPTP